MNGVVGGIQTVLNQSKSASVSSAYRVSQYSFSLNCSFRSAVRDIAAVTSGPAFLKVKLRSDTSSMRSYLCESVGGCRGEGRKMRDGGSRAMCKEEGQGCCSGSNQQLLKKLGWAHGGRFPISDLFPRLRRVSLKSAPLHIPTCLIKESSQSSHESH